MSAPTMIARASLRRRVLPLTFGLYLVLLCWLILWKLEPPFIGAGSLRQLKLIPFVAGMGSGSSEPVEVFANFLLFIPLGIFLGVLAPHWKWPRVVVTAAAISLALETAQYALALGSSDLTDLLVNTLGGWAGFGILTIAHRGLKGKTNEIVALACSIGTIIALLLSCAFALSPLRYAPPRDAISSVKIGDPLPASGLTGCKSNSVPGTTVRQPEPESR